VGDILEHEKQSHKRTLLQTHDQEYLRRKPQLIRNCLESMREAATPATNDHLSYDELQPSTERVSPIYIKKPDKRTPTYEDISLPTLYLGITTITSCQVTDEAIIHNLITIRHYKKKKIKYA